jgi:GR25 family glycosyltransferase involved in LPS biosynthesis
MNHFDIIYIINLKHRTDRLENIMKELETMGVDEKKIRRINAIYDKEFGALGCAQSHRLALSMFMKDKEATNCLILEDDFMFSRDKTYVDSTLTEVFDNLKKWDVLMVSGNLVSVDARRDNEKYVKVYDAQTTSGYAVTKEFVPKLIDCFKKSEENMKKFFKVYHENLIKHNFAIDMSWKALQPASNWYAVYPCIGKQRDGYSDIERREVRYNC